MKRLPSFVLFLILSLSTFAQESSISLGSNTIGLNQQFTITITVANDQLKNYSNFPDISGFQKRGTSSMSSTNIVNGSMTSTSSIVQNYVAEKEGKYVLKPFKMKINGKDVSSQGTTIIVGPPVQAQRRGFFDDNYDPFEEFYGDRKGVQKEYVDVQDDAFFMVQTNKKSVYRGEGFLIMASFYISLNNRAQLQFPSNLSQQLNEIFKKIKPANCWEENFEIHEIVPERVMIDGKPYNRFKVFQAMMYPLNTQTVRIPSVGLDMIKYKEAKNPTFFGNNLQEDHKNYTSKAFEVKVKELPPHPLRETIPVGVFSMQEDIRGKGLIAGKSFTHNFMVMGEGNLSSLEAPQIPENNFFEFYTPEIRQSISRSDNRVTGTKLFSYPVIPREPGEYNLGDYVQIPYFDPIRAKYDTLKSTLKLKIKGESQKNASIQANEYDSFYQLIEKEKNKFSFNYYSAYVKLVANLLLLVMLVATGFIVLRPLKKKYSK
jgi:hypothetical protein